MKVLKRLPGLVLLLVLALCLLAGCGEKQDQPITALSQLGEPGRRIGVPSDIIEMPMLKSDYPQAEIIPADDYQMAYQAVKNGQLDAFVYARQEMILAMARGLTGVRILDETYNTDKVVIGISPSAEIPDLQSKINAFLAEMRADGTLDEMFDRWVNRHEETMPELDMPENPKYHLRVGTTGTVMPYSYFKGTELWGHDIELAYRLAAWLDADVEFAIYDFAGIINAAKTGKIDCIISDLFYQPEAEESIQFSDTIHEVEITAMVRDSAASAAAGESVSGAVVPEFTEFSQLKGKTVSMIVGAPFEDLAISKMPDLGEFTYYSNTPDMLMAVKTGKSDAALLNIATASLAVNRTDGLALFPINLTEMKLGFAFAKDSPEREKWQKAYDTISQETKDALWAKWTGADDAAKIMPAQDWPGSNGTVQAAVCDTLEPMSYAGEGGELMGFDIEMMLLMAKELDVHIEFTGMEFSAVLSYVQSGKALLGAGSVIMTDERIQVMDFVEYYPSATAMIVREVESSGGGQSGVPASENVIESFFDSVVASFEKTFLRESRWKLFVEGIGTTMLITVLSILFGTILGFAVFMLCRNGNHFALGMTRFCVWLVKGMPVVVLLMVLYYIIFAKSDVSGSVVAVIAFTLVFGSGVFAMLRTGVGAISRGQTEAAYALGYGNAQTFFRIILPQAVPHFLPAYKGEIVALIKATAVVGYIAVQDLTKMGDIVRGRTYEAFFPLIAVAIIYFILAAILTFIVNRLEITVNPKRRKKSEILKGIKTES